MRTPLITAALIVGCGPRTVEGSRAALLVTDENGAELQRTLIAGPLALWPGGGWHIEQGTSDVVGTAMPGALGRQDMRITVTTPERQHAVEGPVSFTERTWTGDGAAPWRTRGWIEAPGEPQTESALYTVRVEVELQPPACPDGAPCGIPWAEDLWLEPVSPLGATPEASCDAAILDDHLGNGTIRVTRTGIELATGRLLPCLRIPDAGNADFDVWLTCGAAYNAPGPQCPRRVTVWAEQFQLDTVLRLVAVEVCNEGGDDVILEQCHALLNLGDGR